MSLIVLLDSGLDWTHQALGGTGAPNDLALASGLAPEALEALVDRAISTTMTAEDLDLICMSLTATASTSGPPPGVLGYSSARLYPEMGRPVPTLFDYNGHGTSMLDILQQQVPKLTVLNVRAGYGFDPSIDMEALLDGCEWVLNQSEAHRAVLVMPFGVDAATPEGEVLRELSQELQQAGHTIVASGQHAYVGPQHGGQYPSDLEGVIGVDERLTLEAVMLSWGRETARAYHQPDSPTLPKEGCRGLGLDVVRADADGAVLTAPCGQEVNVMFGRGKPYPSSPRPRRHRTCTLVAPDLTAEAFAAGSVRLIGLGPVTFTPHRRSHGRRAFGDTPRIAAVAHSLYRDAATFGSSAAAPSFVNQRARLDCGDLVTSIRRGIQEGRRREIT